MGEILLFEAREQLDERLKESLKNDYYEKIPQYFDALEIASKCIEAQERLADMLNDFYADYKESDTYSANLVAELLESIRFDFEEKDEGIQVLDRQGDRIP